MFELGPIDDLILPRPRSTTGRALASMSLRRTFEACKALDPTSRHGAAAEAIAALRDAFVARLPGDPHGIAHAIAEPEIGIPLRTGLTDDARLPEAIDRLLVRLGDRPGTVPGSEHPVHGRIRIRGGDPFFERCVGLDASLEVALPELREAIDHLHRRAPATATDLTRFASILLVSDAHDGSIAPVAIGVGTIPRDGDVDAFVTALIRSIVRGRILALVEGRPHDAGAREELVRDAGSAAVAAITGTTDRVTRRPLSLAPEDPLRYVADELDRL